MTPTTVIKRLLRKKGIISLCRATIFFARLVACFNTINRLMFTSQCSLLASQYLWILYIHRVKHLTLKQCEYIFVDCQRNAKEMSLFDMKQVAIDFCTFVFKFAVPKLKKGELKIVCI